MIVSAFRTASPLLLASKVHASFTQVPVFIPTTPRPRLSSVYDDTIFRHDGVLPKWLDVRLAEPQGQQVRLMLKDPGATDQMLKLPKNRPSLP